jgi:tetratricopeptide (TPR) repeat protein
LRAVKFITLPLLLALLGTGCATTGKPSPQPLPVEDIELDPSLIRAEVKDGQVTSEVINSDEAFKKGQEAFKHRDWAEALKYYDIIVRDFPESRYYLPSLYNRALCMDNLEQWEPAIEGYQRVVKEFPGKEAATDALYRMAWCHSNLEHHQDVLELVDRILERSGLEPYDRVEALVRRGDALFALERLQDADEAYREALHTQERAHQDDAVPQDSHFVVAARYGVSQVYHRRFREVKFKLPVETMEASLEKKVQLFQRAQGSYIRTMKMGNPYWATASGYAIGLMYEEFYADLLNAEIPELQQEEANLYFNELRSKLRPLMERALQIYEKNITLSERYGVDNDFTRQTQESLERLKRYITDNELQAEDEERIRKGQSVDRIGEERPRDPRAAPTQEQDEPQSDLGAPAPASAG